MIIGKAEVFAVNIYSGSTSNTVYLGRSVSGGWSPGSVGFRVRGREFHFLAADSAANPRPVARRRKPRRVLGQAAVRGRTGERRQKGRGPRQVHTPGSLAELFRQRVRRRIFRRGAYMVPDTRTGGKH